MWLHMYISLHVCRPPIPLRPHKVSTNVYDQERIRGEGGKSVQERIGPVVQAKSLGRTKNRGRTVVSCGDRR